MTLALACQLFDFKVGLNLLVFTLTLFIGFESFSFYSGPIYYSDPTYVYFMNA